MKKIIYLTTVCSILFANQPSFIASENEIVLNKNQCGFDVSDFDENPSTGYVWSASYDDKVFREPKKEFLLGQAKTGMSGVGGKAIFYFALKPKLCNDGNITNSKITFALARPWENTPAKTKIIEVKFKY
ncbi:MAG: Chagasin family peptidase inhibitor [Pseudomonadota bacterium]|jgi:predicted secreted protein